MVFPQFFPTIGVATTVARICSKAYTSHESRAGSGRFSAGWKRERPAPAKVSGIYLARPETVKRVGRNYTRPTPLPYIIPIYINLFIDSGVRRSEINTRRDAATVQFLQYNI